MNKKPSRIGRKKLFFLLSLLLVGCTRGCAGKDLNQDYGIERLSSCSLEDSPFVDEIFATWSETYHRKVSEVIEADTNSLSEPKCAETPAKLPPPTDELRALATTLPPWKSATRLAQLSENDVGQVLLEYLRTYECAMLEHRTFFYPQYMNANASSAPTLTIGEYNELQGNDTEIIDEEIRVSRKALTRTLALNGRLGRLRTVYYDVNCFLLASLDLRNEFGLASEISSCLARVRDARGSLRDLTELPTL